jgi:hypothetical protein
MAFSKIVARPMASSNKRQTVEDEYEYYKMYVNDSTKATETSATLQYLKLKTAIFRMLEILSKQIP